MIERPGQFIRRLPWRAIGTRLILALIALTFMAVFPGDTPAGGSLSEKVLGQARDDLFNYVAWEVNAVGGKIQERVSGVGPYLTEAGRSQYVHDYLDLITRLETLDSQINDLYSKPSVTDPAAASADLRAKRAAIQAQVDQRQPLAESIMESQVAAVLRDEGIAFLGEVLPPVSSHFTALPLLLIISPRDKIQFKLGINLVPMTVEQVTDLENRIDHDLNVSALAAPLGGLSLYPSMVIQSGYAPAMFEVIAHEWTHHYLYFFPLGLSYDGQNDTRTINESTAMLDGQELAVKTIQRFYGGFPDIMAQLKQYIDANMDRRAIPPSGATQPPAFDYGAVMNETRVTVDKLLASGQIDEAESYMEQQRKVFAAHGYRIRKLNQAYFAFYGGYQSASAGAGGSDPIGPAIREIRQDSPSLKAWLDTMRAITSRDQLLAVRDSLRKTQPVATPGG